MKRLILATIGLALSTNGFAQSNTERIAYDYTAMYEAVSPSVVKVHADSATGSGFLVSSSGMFATNHHVVRNTRYLAVEFPDGRKVPAEIALLDARNDLAILKVNTTTVRNTPPLRLLPGESDSLVKAGMPAVAFGSPLSQTFLMTQGIVSKVEPAVLLGDFLIQAGNSGGPLVNLNGEVIGVNTFAEGGVSGAVRVNVLRDALLNPAIAAYSASEPDATELPVPPRERYPTALLKEKVLSEPIEMDSYVLDAGRFTVTAITPVLIGKLQVQSDLQQAANRYSRRAKKIKDEKYDPVDEPFYDWYRNATNLLETVVTFEIKPDFGQTAGSIWASAIAAAASGYSGRPVMAMRQTMEYKAEFQEMKLYRDNELVQPITPGRQITEQSINNGMLGFVDEAYSGWYVYPASTFITGKTFKVDVYDAREPGRIHRSVVVQESSKLIQQLRRDFAGVLKP